MRALIAEDDPVSRRMLKAFLSKADYEVVVATDGLEAWALLQQPDAPRLVILDWMMPGLDGIQICRQVRQRAAAPYVYILLLTAKGNQKDVIYGLEAGADDYLTKPFHALELKARLRSGRRILELQQQLIAAREAFRLQATHDLLTGLWNHAAILDILQRELARARRESNPLGVIMADLDHFKQVNDTYGHMAGDAVLREVAKRLSSSVRSYDSAARYGGEEFLVVAPNCDPGSGLNLAQRLRSSLDQKPIDLPEGMLSLTCSLGVAVGGLASKDNSDSMLRAADAALYRAKANGRNRIELAASGIVPKTDLSCTVGTTCFRPIH
ncbi:MAG: diguanylate cyclase [Terriglobia bacterium]|jgi:diguanylate cyclase (GGDEF)-like protein